MPNESCARTVTAGVTFCPATVSIGCCTNVTEFTGPAVMLNALLTTTPGVVDTVDPVAVNVYPVPALSIDRPLNVAWPELVFTATVAVPLSVPPPGLFWIASVTVCAVPVTVVPFTSCSVTTALKAPPAVLLRLGLVVKASFAAGPMTVSAAVPCKLPLLVSVAVIV